MEALAKIHAKAHILVMATASPSMPGKGASKVPVKVRSSLTGRFVLAPATKPGKITIAKARSAANAVHSSKK